MAKRKPCEYCDGGFNQFFKPIYRKGTHKTIGYISNEIDFEKGTFTTRFLPINKKLKDNELSSAEMIEKYNFCMFCGRKLI